MIKSIEFVKQKLNILYPFDIENKYYKYVPKIVYLVVLFQIIIEIKLIDKFEFVPLFTVKSGFFYFAIFAFFLYLLLELENYLIFKWSVKIYNKNQWRVKNQLFISFKLGVICFLYIVIFIILLKVKVSGVQPSFLILFLKSISITAVLTMMAFIYDFNYFKKRELIKEIDKIKKDNEFKTTPLKVLENETLLNIVDVHPTFKIDVNVLICCYSELNYVYFVTIQKPSDPIKIKITFKEVEEMFLPYPFFIKCNRGLLVNFNFLETIKSIDKTKVLYLKQIDKPFPISRNYYSKVDLYLTKT